MTPLDKLKLISEENNLKDAKCLLEATPEGSPFENLLESARKHNLTATEADYHYSAAEYNRKLIAQQIHGQDAMLADAPKVKNPYFQEEKLHHDSMLRDMDVHETLQGMFSMRLVFDGAEIGQNFNKHMTAVQVAMELRHLSEYILHEMN